MTFNTPFIVRQCAGKVHTYGYWPAAEGLELKRDGLSWLEQLGRVQDLREVGNISLGETARRRREPIAGFTDRVQRSRCTKHEVVLHHVRIRKDDFNELTGATFNSALSNFNCRNDARRSRRQAPAAQPREAQNGRARTPPSAVKATWAAS
jgi:hypothetical protein